MRASFGLSDVGCVRKNNEDSYLVEPWIGLYVVADGMGGARAGETASRLAVDSLHEAVSSGRVRDEESLIQAFQDASEAVHANASQNPEYEGMGTTLVCALELPERTVIACVGDSRAWIHDHDGLRLITSDQTWINEVGRPLGIPEDRLKSHPMRHVLTMAVGVGETLRVQTHSLQPFPGSIILLTSDGLHGLATEDQIFEILSAGQPLPDAAASLIATAKQAGGPDNITVVLLQY